jgi:glycosyltransferase involved in cell wall biosynthesis
MEDLRKTILFISPGPTYNAHSELYQSQFKELSKNFRGYIFTTSLAKETFWIDDFSYNSIVFDSSKVNLTTLRFVFFCIWSALGILKRRDKVDLVVTYDPLKTGLLGLLISRILRATFTPQVPGVYTSPFEWVDHADNLETSAKRFIYPLIMRFVLTHANGIVLRFKGQIDCFGDVIKGKVIHVSHSFIPVQDFRNIRENKEVLFVGFPFKRKGIDILIGAFKEVALKYPEWSLKILGWFPDLKELNEAIGGHSQIYHHKPVPYDEMREHIGSCGIFVLPSRSEALARVLIEAMASGKPRIGSRVDGIPTIINDGVDGLLFESENIDDLADKLDMLMGDPDLRHRLGKAGETRVKKEFSEERYIRNVTNFYNEVLRKGR